MTRRAWPFLAAAIVLAGGCSLFEQPSQQQATRPVLETPTVAEVETVPAEPVDAEPADPHREETVARVLEFVDRLGTVDEESPNAAKSADAQPPASAKPSANQPAGPQMAANAPAAVAQPAANPADPPASATPPVLETVFVRGEELTLPASESKPPDSTANAPLTTDTTAEKLTLEQWIQTLESGLADAPAGVQDQWKLCLLKLAAGDESAARSLADSLPDDQARELRALIDVLVLSRDSMSDPVAVSDEVLHAAETLRTVISERADLQIPTVKLCTRVQTFGVYDEMPQTSLVPGRPNRVIVYMEIANFASEQTPEGRYRTRLSGQLEVLTPDGRSLWKHEEPEIVDLSAQRRHDFFLAQLVTLPGTLDSGEYVLKATIQDELSGKLTQAVHPVTIGQGAMLAGS